MDRRTLITALATAGITAHGLDSRVAGSRGPSRQFRTIPTLETLLPTTAAVPDTYHDPTGIERSRRLVPAEAMSTSPNSVGVTERTRRFVYRDPDVAPKREIQVTAGLLDESARASETIDSHHEDALEQAFGGRDPGLEYFSDWVEATLDTDTVAGHRRTIHHQRRPQIFIEPDDGGQISDTPYYEYTLILQSTDWGLLEVEVDHQDEPVAGRTERLARSLMTHMREAAAGTVPVATTRDEVIQ